MTFHDFFLLIRCGADLPIDRWSGPVKDSGSSQATESTHHQLQEPDYAFCALPR